MACPFFEPADPWSDHAEPWTGPRRVPLGEPYRGKCSLAPAEIDPSNQTTLCNFGYARGRCPHFPLPDDSAPDAIRFSISNTSAGGIELVWIAEREHAPAAHGQSEYASGAFGPDLPPAYAALARAFVNAYQRGKCPQGIVK